MLTIIDISKKINVELNVVKKLPVDLKGKNSAINIYKNGLIDNIRFLVCC